MKLMAAWLLVALGAACGARAASPIEVNLKPLSGAYVAGESVSMELEIVNRSVDALDFGRAGAPDSLALELRRASDGESFDRRSSAACTPPSRLASGASARFVVSFADFFSFTDSTRYLARAVLVHRGVRYQSALKSFDVVPGMRVATAVQAFANRPDLRREFELVHWGRSQVEHLFLKARDASTGGGPARQRRTVDLGPYLRVTPAKISVLPSGVVLVLHRASQQAFLRNEFWSLPDDLEFHGRETLTDPDLVGTERVKAVYREAGGVKKKEKSWWKFWQ